MTPQRHTSTFLGTEFGTWIYGLHRIEAKLSMQSVRAHSGASLVQLCFGQLDVLRTQRAKTWHVDVLCTIEENCILRFWKLWIWSFSGFWIVLLNNVKYYFFSAVANKKAETQHFPLVNPSISYNKLQYLYIYLYISLYIFLYFTESFGNVG